MVRKMLSVTRRQGPAQAYLGRAVDGARVMLRHELDALGGHWVEVRERLAVARKARGLGDLVRSQVDLLPETRVRLALDWRERRALLNAWWTDLKQVA